MEQKIYSLQEELTNLHRRKGEHAQQIVDLTSKLQETEKNLSLKESLWVSKILKRLTYKPLTLKFLFRLTEAETTIIVLTDEKKQLETSLSEIEGGNQVLRDEHQALQIAYASIEEKLKILHVSSLFSIFIVYHLLKLRNLF